VLAAGAAPLTTGQLEAANCCWCDAAHMGWLSKQQLAPCILYLLLLLLLTLL
jgi:hypothetical protein